MRRGMFVSVVTMVALAGMSDSLAGQVIPKSIASSMEWARTRESRRAQAKDWLAELTRIERQIPTLSPDELKWLKTEYDDQISGNGGRYTARAIRASASKEYAARATKPHAERMIRVLTALSSQTDLTRNSEVRLWAEICELGLSASFWGDIETLVNANVIGRGSEIAPDGGYQRISC